MKQPTSSEVNNNKTSELKDCVLIFYEGIETIMP